MLSTALLLGCTTSLYSHSYRFCYHPAERCSTWMNNHYFKHHATILWTHLLRTLFFFRVINILFFWLSLLTSLGSKFFHFNNFAKILNSLNLRCIHCIHRLEGHIYLCSPDLPPNFLSILQKMMQQGKSNMV